MMESREGSPRCSELGLPERSDKSGKVHSETFPTTTEDHGPGPIGYEPVSIEIHHNCDHSRAEPYVTRSDQYGRSPTS